MNPVEIILQLIYVVLAGSNPPQPGEFREWTIFPHQLEAWCIRPVVKKITIRMELEK